MTSILFNAGHSNREIDIDWLYRQPYERMKAHIERFELELFDGLPGNIQPGLQHYPTHLEREIAERSIQIHRVE